MAVNLRYKDNVQELMPHEPIWQRENIRKYSLYQGVLLTVSYLKDITGESPEKLYDRIEFIANPSLGFPTCDINHIEFFAEENQVKARICVNPLGLIGANSPLPIFYSEQALGDAEQENNTTRDFLNFFNDRLQRLLLPVWKKYRYHASYIPQAADTFSTKLFALIGLGHTDLRASQDLNWKRLLPYLGLISLRAHSGALVESVLRYYFKLSEIHVEQFVKRQVVVPEDQRNQIGMLNATLGESLVIGTSVTDISGKFRIHILMLNWQRFHQLLPINQEYTQLCTLVRFILRDPFDYDIKLQLDKKEIKDFTIGSDSSCLLGWTSWLGKEAADGKILLASKTK